MQQTCIFMTTWGRNVLISETPKKTSFLFFLLNKVREFSMFIISPHALYSITTIFMVLISKTPLLSTVVSR